MRARLFGSILSKNLPFSTIAMLKALEAACNIFFRKRSTSLVGVKKLWKKSNIFLAIFNNRSAKGFGGHFEVALHEKHFFGVHSQNQGHCEHQKNTILQFE